MTAPTTTDQHRLLVHSGTFAALDAGGDITGARGVSPDGLFLRDARHLSRWQLTVDGAVPTVLVPADARGGATARCVLTPASSRAEPAAHTVFREQTVTAGALRERVRIANNLGDRATVRLALTVDADFADQFELRSDLRTYEKPHVVRTREVLPDGVQFGYMRREWRSRTTVTAQPAPDVVGETGSGARQLRWDLELPPHGSAEVTLRASAYPYGAPPAEAAPPQPAGETELPCAAWPELARACRQGLTDLDGLRIPAAGPDGEQLWVPGAGVPWFLALFGRDALLASLFALPYRPGAAAATLPALAAAQATEEDPARDAQPGKIVHEVRHGELAHFRQVPYGRYYGSMDGTPLFLVLLGAYTEHTGDEGLARRLEPHARAAVEWMFRHGGLEKGGYLRYRADDAGRGPAHQCWRDSPGAICFADGSRAKGSVAVAAVQGYAYDALLRTARLARTVWGDKESADRWECAAEDLRRRFLLDFWMPERDFPALALDGEDRRVDALTSEAGHLLWSGLLDGERAEAAGRRLLERDFFSGWGVRTLAAGQPAYHPLSYHRGSVWPHDNAVIALGLARHGLHAEAREVAGALTAMAAYDGHGYRLPEAVAGYAREDHPHPVPYPHACCPQAWAAAAPLALCSAVGARQDAGRPLQGAAG
ncbi:glycogen debranching N-terminal domain-containing protein [Streptomyces sp. ODS28]|uniref:amylo-alpha-1,6-glucosidase n=1 Tax=Streptomyces sp. ODS28 TaxID=3136688 RepID=UPI0031E9AC56